MKSKGLNKKKPVENREFRHFRSQVFVQFFLLALLSVVSIFLVYSLLLRQRFGNFMVDQLQNWFHMDYDAALNFYWHIFRNNIDFFVLLAIGILFLLFFRLYLNWFTRYFMEIDDKMDSLTDESAPEVSLPPELFPIERKMNSVKYTVERQKGDILAAEQRKNDLIMYLAHDLKTPLASVIGYLNLLHDEQGISPELQTKYLEIALNKAERLESLMNEFFEIARFNLSDIALEYREIDLTRLLEQLVFEFQPMLREKNLVCRLEAPETFRLSCDSDKLQRVFDNLLRNAVSYSFSGTEIVITARQTESSLEICFANQGHPIPPEKLSYIFQQFYRLDESRSAQTGGAGLGLAIARQIVELHGGSITAQSAEEQTSFLVTLPLS